MKRHLLTIVYTQLFDSPKYYKNKKITDELWEIYVDVSATNKSDIRVKGAKSLLTGEDLRGFDSIKERFGESIHKEIESEVLLELEMADLEEYSGDRDNEFFASRQRSFEG